MFEYSVRRSKRAKRVSIKVSSSAEVEVIAPKHVPERRIDSFVSENSNWIETQLHKFSKLSRKKFNQNIEKEIFFLGRKYLTEIRNSKKQGINLGYDKAIFHSKTGSKKELREILEKFYRNQTRKIAENLIKKKGYKINRISVRGQKTRWGSCSKKGNLNLNWKLAIAPLPVFNYVICHEISHLKHFNHSKQFWKEVESICPDYKDLRRWLNKNGLFLTI